MRLFRILSMSAATLAFTAFASLSVQAQSFVYIGIDPSDAVGDIMTSNNATLGGEPFWSAVEPHIGKSGRCERPTIDDKGAKGVFVSQREIDAILKGFKLAQQWMTTQSLWPLKRLQLVPRDQRAPRSIPIFCSTQPTGDSVLNAIEDRGPDGASSYFVLNTELPFMTRNSLESLETSAIQALLKTILADVNIEVFEDNDTYFGNKLGLDTQGQDYKQLVKLFLSMVNAMSFTVIESDFAYGPYAINQKVRDESSKEEQEYYYLEGDYHKPFHLFPNKSNPTRTSSAFWNLLFDGYLNVGYETVRELLKRLATSANQLQTVNEFIDTHDGKYSSGLVHALPNLTSAASNLYQFRKYKPGQEEWSERILNGCKSHTISDNNQAATLDLSLSPYASQCVKLDIQANEGTDISDVHIKAITGDERVDQLEIAISNVHAANDKKLACYEHLGYQSGNLPIEKQIRKGLVNDKTCLLYFNQGDTPDSKLTQRFFYLAPEDEVGSDTLNQYRYRLLVTYTPKEHASLPEDLADPVDVTLTFAADIVHMESVLFDESSVESVFGSKVGKRPIAAAPIKKAEQFDDSVLEGRATAVDPGLLSGVGSFVDDAIGVQDDNSTSIQFKFKQPDTIESKSTGEFEVIPIFQKDGFLAIPDPDKKSQINIVRHEPDTLYFEADAHICMLPIEKISASLENRYLDICEEGEKHQVKTEVHVPFPDQFRSKTRITWKETDNYRFNRERRLQQLRTALTTRGMAPIKPSSGANDQNDNIRSSGNINTGQSISACPIKDNSGQCNCTCDVKACLNDNPEIAGQGEALSCRLSCGKKWRSC